MWFCASPFRAASGLSGLFPASGAWGRLVRRILLFVLNFTSGLGLLIGAIMAPSNKPVVRVSTRPTDVFSGSARTMVGGAVLDQPVLMPGFRRSFCQLPEARRFFASGCSEASLSLCGRKQLFCPYGSDSKNSVPVDLLVYLFSNGGRHLFRALPFCRARRSVGTVQFRPKRGWFDA